MFSFNCENITFGQMRPLWNTVVATSLTGMRTAGKQDFWLGGHSLFSWKRWQTFKPEQQWNGINQHFHVLERSSQDPHLIPVKNLTGPMLFCEQRMEKTAVSGCAKLVETFPDRLRATILTQWLNINACKTFQIYICGKQFTILFFLLTKYEIGLKCTTLFIWYCAVDQWAKQKL